MNRPFVLPVHWARMLGTICLLLSCGVLPARAQTADSAMARIKAHDEVVLGFRQSSIPFSYLDANQKPVGYSIDLCLAVVASLKRQLGRPDLKVRFVPVDLSTIIPLLQNGSIDMECGSTVHTLKRAAQVDFSFVTAAAADQLLVKADSKIREFEDLAGKALAVPAGSTNAALAQSLDAQKKLNIRLVLVKDQAEGFLAVSTGRADAYLSDNVILYGLKKRANDAGAFRVGGRALSYLPYGIVVAPNNSALLAVINATLAENFRSGHAAELYVKWFSQIGMSLDQSAQRIFQVDAIPG
ncbi:MULTISPECIES: amino acid ABC transporter substrate-binding protein [unclassified Burkholderia]|uniref:amino acid ABC transporter substrate-binding protein n=1 Tax=unclassified Burkholderia TaxID=2613784 RepID=UPI0014202E64|nr:MULTISPECIES: amino acid ABC transporter substrate-binding protein [unclassified Burkholderia]NIE83378.1 amino acid ABC transporter substrate-binding protein [Burkholderia sp. Tr-860]NIF61714.1 amino acid ABC transporter substrate-binding protein [Burkholderia sp. Cy-647]NIF96887.1 amino acid ABC transporter substrate-binding protein [Burkholderia sp. Ax-1720]